MADKDLTIQQGKTFSLVIRWETEPVVRKPITGISLTSGAPRLNVPSHAIPNGWRCYVTLVKGMAEINAKNNPPKNSDIQIATVVDPSTVEFNAVNPINENGREWSDYVSGGFLQYNTPVDLTGYTARMDIKDKVGGTVLASTDVLDAPKNVLTINVDNATKTITLSILATNTDDFAWTKGVYDLEMVGPTGTVTSIMSGKVTVTKEITT